MKQQVPDLTVSIREIDSAEAAPGLLDGAMDLAFFRLDGAPGEGIDGFPVNYDQLCVALPDGQFSGEQGSDFPIRRCRQFVCHASAKSKPGLFR